MSISRDGGRSWKETREIARDPDVDFYETALVRLASGRLVAHMRTVAGGGFHLYQVTSEDGGETWSKPVKTPIWGFPADLIQLRDGRLLTVYGHRRQPFGIRACISRDEGRTWDIDREIVLRDDLHSSNLGYPTGIVLDDGSVTASRAPVGSNASCATGPSEGSMSRTSGSPFTIPRASPL